MSRSMRPWILLLVFAAGCGVSQNPAVESAKKGDDARKKDDWDLAIAHYTDAIRLNPKLARAYYGRGTAYCAKSESTIAIADLSEAIRLDPMNARATAIGLQRTPCEKSGTG